MEETPSPPWNRRVAFLDWARWLCLVAVIFTSRSFAGTVTTLDGRAYQGTLRWEGSNLVVSPPGGAGVRLPLASVRQARFVEGPKPPASESSRSGVQHRPTVEPFGGRPRHVKVEYFTDREMKQVGMVRFDQTIDQFWPNGTSPQGLPPSFSGRWTARLRVPAAGATNPASALVLKCDGGARLWLDDQLVLDCWDKPNPDHAWNVPFQTGHAYKLRLEYWRHWPQACLILHRWNTTHDRVRPLVESNFLPAEDATNRPPDVTLVEPDDGAVFTSGSRLVLEAEMGGGHEPVRQMRFKDRDRDLGVVLHPPWRFTVDAIEPGLHGFSVEALTERGTLARTHRSWVCAADPVGAAASSPWRRIHLADPASSTSAALDDNRLVLSHRGGHLRQTADSFGGVVRASEADFELTARLVSLAVQGSTDALAGLCLQDWFRSGAPRTCLVADPTGQIFGLRRAEEATRPTERAETCARPVWLRLTRRGDTVASSFSTDGSEWRVLETAPPGWGGPTWVGFVVCASNASATAEAVFDHIGFTQVASEAGLGNIGLLLTNGSFLATEPAALDSLRLTGAEVSLAWGEPARPLTFPVSSLARIFYKPVSPTDVLLRADRAGLLLWGGDFIEGPLAALSNRVATVDSLLFGRKDYPTGDEVAAVLLREPKPPRTGWQVTLRNGTTLMTRGLAAKGDRLLVEEPLLGPFPVPQAEVVELDHSASP